VIFAAICFAPVAAVLAFSFRVSMSVKTPAELANYLICQSYKDTREAFPHLFEKGGDQ